MPNELDLTRVAMASDTQDLLQHIAWTDVLKPKLLRKVEGLSGMLVNHLLGAPLPEGLTKEQVAGKIYGIRDTIALIELVLSQGQKALENLTSQDYHISGL